MPTRLTWLTVLRNMALIGFAIVVTLRSPQPLSLDSWIAGGGTTHSLSNSGALALLVVGTLAVVAAAIFQEAHNLLKRSGELKAALTEERR
jgi:hypothetical protein